MKPNYKQLYEDIINEKFPEKIKDDKIKNKIGCLNSAIDIVLINTLIFGDKKTETQVINQKLRSYDEDSIKLILEYQKKNKLSNIKTAKHFKLSRNSIAKWKKVFS